MEVPFLSFREMNRLIRSAALATFERFFDEGQYIMGERLSNFERSYAEFCGTKFCAGTSNGLDALTVSLKALGVGEGDEVIIPSNTFVASALAVLYAGARPVLVEPDEFTFNITAPAIEKALTKKTRVVMPVHLYGQACEMSGILEVASKNGLVVLEDNAQAQGASFNGKPTGSWGAAAGTSFYPGKNIGAYGDAGAVTSNDEEVIRKVRLLRNYGSEKKYHHVEAGYNMRMDELQAALLLLKLDHLGAWNAQRQALAAHYLLCLSDVKTIILPRTAPGSTHVYHLFVIRAREREALQAHLSSCGIGTLIHYPVPLFHQKALSACEFKGKFDLSLRLASEVLSLPVWPGMSTAQVEYVSDAIRQFYRKR